MATVLLAVVIALVVGHTIPDLARLRDFGWFGAWIRTLASALGNVWKSPWALLFTLGLPLLLMAAVQQALDDAMFGLAEVALGVAVLFYCWGPRDLDLDVDAIISARDAERRTAALQALPPEPPQPPLPLQGPVLVDEVFRAALSRWFGPLFWFLILGPFGVLTYRLVQHGARTRTFSSELPAAQVATLEKLAQLLDFLPAQLMTLALAIAADFDSVAAAWRDFHVARDRRATLDIGFLLAAARASVDSDVEGGDAYVEETRPLTELHQAMALVWRILVVWLVAFSVMVLAGFVG
jgi:AmpE protein